MAFRTVLAIGALSCGGRETTPSATRVASSLVVAGGDAQHAVVGTELPAALVVRVVDRNGQPVPGQSVSFVVVRGGGHVYAGASLSNADGIVQERWTLGTVATDSQIVEARAVDNSTGAALLFATFHATATPDTAVAIRALAGDAQQGALGNALPVSVVTQVVDRYGNGVPGRPMTFTVLAGGGSTSPATATTDSTGRAQTRWTLGTRLDTVHVLAAGSGTLPPARFTATPSLPASATVTAIAGDGQDGIVGTSLATPVRVLVAMPDGQPIAGARVLWAVVGNGGSIADPVSVTAADGTAQTTWTLGHVAGANELSATVLGAASASFHATARADAATTLEIRGGDAQAGLPGSNLPAPLVVRALDQFGNPVPGEAVDWSTDTGSVTPARGTTDANGESSATLTLGATSGTVHVTAALTRNSATHASFTARAKQLQLTIQPGLPSSNTVGALLAQPLVAKVTADGAPLAGVSVTFAAVSGGGSLAPSPVITDALGLASSRWVLGTVAGRDSATVSIPNVPAVGIGITATAAAPAHVTPVSGSGQSASVGETLAQPLVAHATDRYGNLVNSVNWTSDGGSITPIAADTDGNVRATWTVTRAGTLNAMAIAGTDTAKFSATVGAAPGSYLTLNGAPSGTLVVARGVSVSVTLRDANGAVVSGAPVRWKITGGNGSFSDIQLGTVFVDTATTLTNAGGASLTWYLGRRVGENTLVVTAPGAAPLTVKLTSVPDQACTTGINGADPTTGYIGTGMAGTVLPTVLTAYALDTWGNPTTGAIYPPAPNGGAIIRLADGTFRVQLGPAAGPVQLIYTELYPGMPLQSGYALPRTGHSALTATATAGPATAISIASGDAQTAPAGTTVQSPLTAIVTDAYGNPVSGATIVWAVTAGGGSITPSSVTGADGRATASWTLGATRGTNSAEATVSGTSISVRFTATGS